MPFFYKDTRKRVTSINEMTDDNIFYELVTTSGYFNRGTYSVENGKPVRVSSSPPTIPDGMTPGRVFRVGSYEYRLLGETADGTPLVEEVSSNYISRFQVRSVQTSGNDEYVNFNIMDFGPSDFVDLNDGVFTLASGISHELRAGCLETDRQAYLQWGCIDDSGNVELVGSRCGAPSAGVCGGTAVYTNIPVGDKDFALYLTDPSAIISDVWATVASQFTLQTVVAPTDPTGVPQIEPPPTVPPSGSAPPPSGTSYLGLGFNASGHTIINVSGTTIYVSSISGSDSNDGLSPSTPKLTLGAAKNAVGNGNNRILCERGGTYTAPTNNPSWNRGGLSREYPFVISAYGTGAKPIVTIEALHQPVSWLALIDLDTRHCRSIKGSNGWLFERCNIKVMDIQGDRLDATNWLTPHTGLYIRFCTILDSGYAGAALWHGLYTVNIWDVILEYNVWDHNGWPAGIDRFTATAAEGAPTQHEHNAYCNLPGGPVTFRYNIVRDASSHVIHQRTGGINAWNLFVHNPMMQMGYSTDGKLVYAPNGVSGYIGNNVAITATDITAGYPRGIFLQLNNINGLVVENNIACFSGPDSNANKVFVRQERSAGMLNDIQYLNNIAYQWTTPANGIQTVNPTVGLAPTNIVSSGNDFESGAITYADPSGALAYAADAFISGCRVSGIIIGGTTDPTLIINSIKAMFTPV